MRYVTSPPDDWRCRRARCEARNDARRMGSPRPFSSWYTGSMTALPLEGIRILGLTQLGAGPYAMTLLGDLGAEIIKIEDPTIGGDEARTVPPFAADGDSPYFQSLNRNAKSLTLNLRAPGAR